jgi:hypothetical protein
MQLLGEETNLFAGYATQLTSQTELLDVHRHQIAEERARSRTETPLLTEETNDLAEQMNERAEHECLVLERTSLVAADAGRLMKTTG